MEKKEAQVGIEEEAARESAIVAVVADTVSAKQKNKKRKESYGKVRCCLLFYFSLQSVISNDSLNLFLKYI